MPDCENPNCPHPATGTVNGKDLCDAHGYDYQEFLDLASDRELTPYERWMVKSNVENNIPAHGRDAVIDTLRAGGYHRVAAAVEEALERLDNEPIETDT